MILCRLLISITLAADAALVMLTVQRAQSLRCTD